MKERLPRPTELFSPLIFSKTRVRHPIVATSVEVALGVGGAPKFVLIERRIEVEEVKSALAVVSHALRKRSKLGVPRNLSIESLEVLHRTVEVGIGVLIPPTLKIVSGRLAPPRLLRAPPW